MMGFHWREGLYFRRQPDGAVAIIQVDDKNVEQARVVIPASEWASIVSSVSVGGETDGRYFAAQDFHNSTGQVAIARINYPEHTY